MTYEGPLFGPETMNAPWGLKTREKLVALASRFFNANNISASHAAIGKALPNEGNPRPVTASDFLNYLNVTGAFPKTPNAFRVLALLESMASHGRLMRAGQDMSSIAGLGNYYLYMPTPQAAKRGLFGLVGVLGPEYLFELCAAVLMHITGKNEAGDAVAGTGLVVDERHVLTCRHVVADMQIDSVQAIQGRQYAVRSDEIHAHPNVDVAVMRLDGPPLTPLSGAVFQAPNVAQTVYTLGYPKLPGLRDASVTMQPGAVTNAAVTSLAGEQLFLYSAISRPGNSGGPVMSDDGYVVGLSIVDATGSYDAGDAFSPHYAGIPGQVIVSAVEDLGLGIDLQFEAFE
ncbi:MAG: trypsin-like peptidase domain-containing protein [Cenarchaeum sp. SB0669_bin_11]|nr:trypsin-like peptidase domain-containing protein [Gammaproteobacteria bacterium]MYL11536.1 trypsin-like peptidase domain-containing protein [Cenarchaeum sp. SB0669_bin_11]